MVLCSQGPHLPLQCNLNGRAMPSSVQAISEKPRNADLQKSSSRQYYSSIPVL